MSAVTYNEGDLVEAVNEDGAKLTGFLGKREDGLLYLGAYHWIFPTWVAENAGFSTITVIEKAKPQLPTEHGAYRDKDGDLWVLTVDGEWHDFSTGNETHHKPGMSPGNYRPFTRLEPAAETVKKVLDRIADLSRDIHYSKLDKGTFRVVVSDEIAAEYGVTL